jgi:hypothetical protein
MTERKGARPPKHISRRWPGAGSQGVRRAIVTNRNKKIRVTLACPHCGAELDGLPIPKREDNRE